MDEKFVEQRIKELNIVTRSCSQPREGETGAQLGARYVKALTVYHAEGFEAAKQYFDKPPKENKC